MSSAHRCVDALPPELQARLETIVDAFEDAWQRPRPPQIEAFLPDDALLYRAVLIELVHVDLEYRLKRNAAIRVEAYFRDYPLLREETAALMELLATEFTLRCRREPDLTTEEYVFRFPTLRGQLRQHLVTAYRSSPRNRRPVDRSAFAALDWTADRGNSAQF